MRAHGLVIDPDWQDALARAGCEPAQLAHGELGALVQSKPGREVRRLELPGRPPLFVKRIALAGLRARWRALRGRDPATREAEELLRVARAGVRAARPVVYGAADLSTCVLATEALPGVELTRALAAAGPAERERLVRATGELLARLHAQRILQEVRCKDVIVAPEGDLALFDRDPRNAWAEWTRHPDGALQCLARCEYLRLRGGAPLTDAERSALLARYCEVRGSGLRVAAAAARVRAALAVELARHRASPSLMAEFGPLVG